MNIRRLSRIIIYSTAALLSVMLTAACTATHGGEDTEELGFETGIPAEVSFSLSSRPALSTKADEDGRPMAPNQNVEKIHNWWIAFVDRKGAVTILQRPDGELAADAGIESETFKTIINTGTYNIYAFANIATPENPENFIKGLLNTENKISGKALNDVITNPAFIQDGMQWDGTKNIPMTGFLEGVRIQNTIEEAFAIEVVRTVAKIEFAFTNPNDEKIILKNLTLNPITKSDVALLPQYGALGHYAYTAFGTPAYGTLTFNLADRELQKSSTPGYSFNFYCKESLAPAADQGDDKKDCFRIALTVNRNAATADVTKIFYTSRVKSYINRNDWVYIPIEFNDWKIYWKLHYYPPIGGYPPVFYQNEDGSSLAATLTTGGEFELYPVKIEKNGESYNLSKIDWSTVALETTNEGLFLQAPAKVANPGNPDGHPANTEQIIAGELDPTKTGDATVKITFSLKDNEASGTVFPCTFTIHRKNGNP